MTRPIPTLAAVLCLLTGGAALAQETTPTAPEAPHTDAPAATEPAAPDALSLGAPADDGIGSTYVEKSFGDWQQRCIRAEDGSDPCQLYQLLKDAQGNPVAEISVFGLPPDAPGPAVAGATVVAPLETLLTQDLTLQVDSTPARKYPFSWCSPIGCIARIGFTADEVSALKRGKRAELSIVPVIAPDQVVKVEASLTGFTAGYDAVQASNLKIGASSKGAAPAEGGAPAP